MTGHRHKVVIIGSGFGGISAARALKHAEVDITLISKTTYHLFQPLLYQVATGILAEGEIAPLNRVILHKQRNIRVVLGEVTDIDLKEKKVISHYDSVTTEFSYDSLIVATGSDSSYFGNDHFAAYAPGLKTIDDALEVRSRLIEAFERAEVASSAEEREKLLTFAIIGAGPTGVELAGQFAEISEKTLSRSFDNVKLSDVKIVLLDGAPAVLPPMGKKLGKIAENNLTKIGIDVRLNALVIDIDNDGLKYKDGNDDNKVVTLPSAVKVWSAGVAASSLGRKIADQTGAEADRAGRVSVQPDLTVPGESNVFIIGDLMSVKNVPGMVQGAIQGGQYAAKAIAAGIAGGKPEDRKPFKYKDKGSLSMVSKGHAVAHVGKLEFGGVPAWILWLGIHLYYLVGIENRFITLLAWAYSFTSPNRGQLTTSKQLVDARNALGALRDESSEELATLNAKKIKEIKESAAPKKSS